MHTITTRNTFRQKDATVSNHFSISTSKECLKFNFEGKKINAKIATINTLLVVHSSSSSSDHSKSVCELLEVVLKNEGVSKSIVNVVATAVPVVAAMVERWSCT
jgi:hypothetical protein